MKKLLFILVIYFCFVSGYAQQTITPETALSAYIHNDDPTWGWEVRKTYEMDEAKAYSLLFISQKWQGIL
jgi:hypothetical protein